MGVTWIPLVAVACGFLLGAMGTAVARSIARRIGFVDRPGGHKGHSEPVALGGGVAVTLAATLPILVGVAIAWWAASDRDASGLIRHIPDDLRVHLAGIASKAPEAAAIVGCAWMLCLVGLRDDARPLRASVRFAVQFLVAAVLVIGLDLRLLSHAGYGLSVILSVLWIVTLINSMNFLDNTDGLSSGVAIIAASVFAVASMRTGQIFVPTCCWLLVGALAGFLPFNYHPASIYLGDAGSTVVGFLLAIFTILTTFADPAQGQRPLGVLAPLAVMAVPLYDTASVFFLRWRSGDPLWRGDRRHFSHRLLRRGIGVRQAVAIIWLATLVTALPAIALSSADWPMALGIMTQTLLVVCLVALLERSGSDGQTQ
jgi:UDP-GlcNAc:undecaprenyl-phosphate GlcNAc-1-phosphate transferase